MHSLLQDTRYGLRQLRKSPSFTLTAVLTLAFGIGATTALFSVVDGVLLKPLAYRDNGRLVVIWEKVRFLEKLMPYTGANPRQADIWRRQSTSFDDLTLVQQTSTGVGLTNDHPRLIGRISALPNLLDILGVQPVLGRNFLPEEAIQGHEKVVILSWHLWQTLFNADPAVTNRTIQIAGAPYQVVGVLPKNFYFPKANELASAPLAGQLPDTEVITPSRSTSTSSASTPTTATTSRSPASSPAYPSPRPRRISTSSVTISPGKYPPDASAVTPTAPSPPTSSP